MMHQRVHPGSPPSADAVRVCAVAMHLAPEGQNVDREELRDVLILGGWSFSRAEAAILEALDRELVERAPRRPPL